MVRMAREKTSRPADAAEVPQKKGTQTASGIKKKSRLRLWCFRVIAIVLIPALFLGLLELGLRIGGYGYRTDYFVELQGQPKLAGNPRFGWRFFPPAIARMPIAFPFDSKKASDTCRIFILGSSAAQGFPDPLFSFGRLLEVLLRDRHPGMRFEVINTAMVAINSHVLVPIAADCAEREPDVFIVYEGNNEIVGPYGPGTVFGGMTPSLWMTRLSVSLRATRLGQLATSINGVWRGAGEVPREWKGMEFFLGNRLVENDARVDRAAEYFSHNLSDICRIGRRAGAKVLLCTVGVNLKDCPPFASAHRAGLESSREHAWDDLYREAGEARGDVAQALKNLAEAERIDDQFAELHFRIGRIQLKQGHVDAARTSFRRARDLDTLRFRADSRMNAAVRRAAQDEGATLVDIEALFEDGATNPGRIAGGEVFFEHCHMNLLGNYLIARNLMDQLEKLIPPLAAGGVAGPKAPLGIEECEARMGYGALNEVNDLKAILQLEENPPFTNQLDHAERYSQMTASVQSKAAKVTRDALVSHEAECRKALRTAPNDIALLKNQAMVLGLLGSWQDAIKALEQVVALWPGDTAARSDLGTMWKNVGKMDEAKSEYRMNLDSSYCDRKCQAEMSFNLAVVEERSGHPASAITYYERAIGLSPSDVRAITNLGLLLDRQGNWERAATLHRRVIELSPKKAIGYINLAIVHFRHSQFAEAADWFAKAMRLEPENDSIQCWLGSALLNANRPSEALGQYQAVIGRNPGLIDAERGVGACLLGLGRPQEAIPHFEAVLRGRADDGEAKAGLAQAKKGLETGP
jgi:tetratricopeptide (TPR) repeat protein